MATVYLSIGLPGTGSTQVQAFLRENKKILNQKGYCFPDFGPQSGREDRNGHFLLEKSDIREKGFQTLGNLVKKYSQAVLIDEEIWKAGSSNRQFWTDTIKGLQDINCELKVVVYLYRQDLLVQSLWKQSIRSSVTRETKSFDECMANGFSDFPLDYYENLKEIEKHVGRENLIVRVYENDQFGEEGRSLLSDFLDSIGLAMTGQYTTNTVCEELELKGNLIEVKRLLNGVWEYRRMDDFMGGSVDAVNRYLAEKGQFHDTSMFAPGRQEAYLKEFEESNQKTAKEFFERTDGRLFYKPVEQLPQWKVDSDTIYQDIVLFLEKVFCKQQQALLRLRKKVEG